MLDPSAVGSLEGLSLPSDAMNVFDIEGLTLNMYTDAITLK